MTSKKRKPERVFLVKVVRTTTAVYEVQASTRQEAADDVKKLSDNELAMTYEVQGGIYKGIKSKRKIVSIITRDLVPKKQPEQ